MLGATISYADAQQESSIVSQFLDSGTIAVASASLDQIDIEAFAESVTGIIPFGEAFKEEAFPVLGPGLAGLQATGAARIHVIASTSDLLNRSVIVVVETKNPQQTKEFLQVPLKQSPEPMEIFLRDNHLVITKEQTWNRINSRSQPIDRPELLSALARVSKFGIRGAVAVRPDLHREIVSIMPASLPDGFPQLNPRQIAQQVHSIAIGFNVDAQPIKLTVIQCADPQSSQRIAGLLKRVVAQNLRGLDPDTLITTENELVMGDLSLDDLSRMLGPVVKKTQVDAQRKQLVNSMKQIGLGMHNFHDSIGYLPPQATVSETGKPLLSWRVFLLPYIEEHELYERFHLDEPWDSPHNIKLAAEIPFPYQSPDLATSTGLTRVMLPLGEGTAWKTDGPPIRFRNIINGTSNTIAAVRGPVDKAVVWTKPDDLVLTGQDVVADAVGDSKYLIALMFDGSVLTLDPKADKSQIGQFLGVEATE